MSTTQHDLEWVKPPLQARSQQTLARLLDATEALIEEKGIEKVTVAEIARRASSSVGAFYARFTDKEALLRCVLERFYEQASATTDMALASERWRDSELPDALNALMLFMVRVLRERRQLIVAMMVRAATDPGLTALAQRLHEQITVRMGQLLIERGTQIDHHDPARALSMCVWLMLSAVETRLLYANHEPADALTDEQLAEELALLCVRYLGLEQADAPRSANRRKLQRADLPAADKPTDASQTDGGPDAAQNANERTARAGAPIRRRAKNTKTNRRRRRRHNETSTG